MAQRRTGRGARRSGGTGCGGRVRGGRGCGGGRSADSLVRGCGRPVGARVRRFRMRGHFGAFGWSCHVGGARSAGPSPPPGLPPSRPSGGASASPPYAHPPIPAKPRHKPLRKPHVYAVSPGVHDPTEQGVARGLGRPRATRLWRARTR
ncbi:hypothetical protein SSBG_00051 [Streptomyces sp. SPB074]|nr:hypothetical protein SSBG_00051 [Streptomyces sp. SPB074]